METFTSIIKKIVFVLIILVFSCSGYFFILLKGEKQSLPSFLPFAGEATNASSTISSEKEIADLQQTLSDLEKIKINSSFFSSPSFKNLKSFKEPLPELTPGRVNPFAPIGEETAKKAPLPKPKQTVDIVVPVVEETETNEVSVPSV